MIYSGVTQKQRAAKEAAILVDKKLDNGNRELCLYK
jgi:hypothetical protein